jgi:hypothetical protein
MRTVVICGDTLLAAGIAGRLQPEESVRVVRIDPGMPSALERIQELSPVALIFDFVTIGLEPFAGLLREYAHLLLIGVDTASGELLVLSGRRLRARKTDQLLQIIQRAARTDMPRDEAHSGTATHKRSVKATKDGGSRS